MSAFDCFFVYEQPVRESLFCEFECFAWCFGKLPGNAKQVGLLFCRDGFIFGARGSAFELGDGMLICGNGAFQPLLLIDERFYLTLELGRVAVGAQLLNVIFELGDIFIVKTLAACKLFLVFILLLLDGFFSARLRYEGLRG